jgi:LytS/YehU family sensor histidine kinase
MIYGNIAGIMYVSQVNEKLRLEVRRRELAESLQTSAELSALRAQLNPHFLFNTLNSIMALAGPGQPQTMQAISHLASMLRYTLSRDMEGEDVSLRQELAFTDQYLVLESLRLGGRLQILRDIAPEALSCRVPPLTLQPLVENAIRHGIAPRAGRGTLILRAYVAATSLHLEVQDDGLGSELAAVSGAKGLGVRTVKQRLDLLSNGHATLAVETAPGQGCRISISLPQDAREASAIPIQEAAQVAL